jgi:hypothetical protein
MNRLPEIATANPTAIPGTSASPAIASSRPKNPFRWSETNDNMLAKTNTNAIVALAVAISAL